MNWTERLKQSRERAGLSLEQAAAAINVEPADWASWESGTIPGCVPGMAAAKLLAVDPFWLFNVC